MWGTKEHYTIKIKHFNKCKYIIFYWENRILNYESVTFSHFKHWTFLTSTLNLESDIFIITNFQWGLFVYQVNEVTCIVHLMMCWFLSFSKKIKIKSKYIKILKKTRKNSKIDFLKNSKNIKIIFQN